ncbi:GNAT family N-acetyltransferase [Spirochaeta dissipatitropha]
MASVLIIGAGVTGSYIAARLHEHGISTDLLARGQRAELLKNDGLRLRNGITGEQRIVHIPVVLEEECLASDKQYDLILVSVQEQQRVQAAGIAARLPGSPPVWFPGNTSRGFSELLDVLGPERVLGGFPGIGGTWEDGELVYADRKSPDSKPFHWLVVGEVDSRGRVACRRAITIGRKGGFRVKRQVPIESWQLCHAVLVVPLAAFFYEHDCNMNAVAADSAGLRRVVGAITQGLKGLSNLGIAMRPRSMYLMRIAPTAVTARKLAGLLSGDFARIAMAAHARTARSEMSTLAAGLLDVLGDQASPDLKKLLQPLAKLSNTAAPVAQDSRNTEIRKADLENPLHVQAILHILNEYAMDLQGEPLPDSVLQEIVPGLKSTPTSMVFLAVNGREIIGLAICFLGFATFQARPIINVHDLAVLAPWRGRGIGRSLLHAVEQEAARLNCSKVTLEVLGRNPGARHLYERLGYKGSDPDSAEGLTFFLSKKLDG